MFSLFVPNQTQEPPQAGQPAIQQTLGAGRGADGSGQLFGQSQS